MRLPRRKGPPTSSFHLLRSSLHPVGPCTEETHSAEYQEVLQAPFLSASTLPYPWDAVFDAHVKNLQSAHRKHLHVVTAQPEILPVGKLWKAINAKQKQIPAEYLVMPHNYSKIEFVEQCTKSVILQKILNEVTISVNTYLHVYRFVQLLAIVYIIVNNTV